MFQDFVIAVYDVFDWLFPSVKCEICNPKKKIDWAELICLKYGKLLFLYLPIGIILYHYFPSPLTILVAIIAPPIIKQYI